MRKDISPEFDAFMWTVAESGDDLAIDQFGERYPEMRAEMLKRLAMIRELKASKPGTAFANTPPRFVPPLRSSGPSLPRWAWAMAPILLAGIAFGSFQVATKFMGGPEERPKPEIIKYDVNGFPDPNIVQNQKEPDTNLRAPEYKVGPIKDNVEVVEGGPVYERPIDLQAENTTLIATLNLIQKKSGLRIERAPGFQDFQISMKYSGLSPVEVLRDLGRNFGFSVFEQEPGHVLLIPEVDPKTQEGVEHSQTVDPKTTPGIEIRPDGSAHPKPNPSTGGDQ